MLSKQLTTTRKTIKPKQNERTKVVPTLLKCSFTTKDKQPKVQMEWLLLASRFDTNCHAISNFLLEDIWFGALNVHVHSISLMRRIWGHRFATNTPQARDFKRRNCKNSRKRETAVKYRSTMLLTQLGLGPINFQCRTIIAQDH